MSDDNSPFSYGYAMLSLCMAWLLKIYGWINIDNIDIVSNILTNWLVGVATIITIYTMRKKFIPDIKAQIKKFIKFIKND